MSRMFKVLALTVRGRRAETGRLGRGAGTGWCQFLLRAWVVSRGGHRAIPDGATGPHVSSAAPRRACHSPEEEAEGRQMAAAPPNQVCAPGPVLGPSHLLDGPGDPLGTSD